MPDEVLVPLEVPVVLVPLGVVVDTDVKRTLQAFGDLFKRLHVYVNPQALSTTLMPKFHDFAYGKYKDKDEEESTAEQKFGNALLQAIKDEIAKIQDPNKQPLVGWEHVWNDEWRDCWNAMCEVTDNTIEIAKIILDNPDIKFIIYSETNSIHIAKIKAVLIAKGIAIDTFDLRTTYQYGMPIEDVLAQIKQEDVCKNAIKEKTFIVVTGDPTKVDDAVFKPEAQAKRQRIASGIGESNDQRIAVKQLHQAQLTPAQLLSIIDDLKSFSHLTLVHALFEKERPRSPKPT